MGWKGQVALDSAKALLPGQAALRRWQRRRRPYRTDPRNDAFCLRQGLDMLSALGVRPDRPPGVVLELGSGWTPIIPALFHVAGADRLHLTDLEALMDAETEAHALSVVRGGGERLAARTGLSPAAIDARLAGFAFDYHCPFRGDELPDGSVDLVTSRTVLEHVSPATLAGLMATFHRLLRPGGRMCHVVDHSDHFEHADKSIGRLNFLRYSDRAWAVTQLNPQNAMNRLRHSDYVKLFEAAGFAVTEARGEPDPAALASLDGFEVAERFRRYPPEELATLTSLYVLERG